MITARIAVIALAVVATTLTAQQAQPTHFSIKVADQSGAVIPGTRIVATDSATGSRISAVTDATGQAVVPLDHGTYELRIMAGGFEAYQENEVEVKTEMPRNIVLRIDSSGHMPILVQQPEGAPLEHQPFAIEIPLVPTQEFPPTSRRLHNHFHRL